ncbi:MAG: hypothetical protein RIQ60_3031 [Pseudomonadota bacterium]|jgi:hypothetical protein
MSTPSHLSVLPSSEHIDLPLALDEGGGAWRRLAHDWRRLLSVAGALALTLAVLPATLAP